MLALDSVGDGVWDWDMTTDKVYSSPRWKALLGYADDEISDSLDEWRRLTHPEDLPRALEAIRLSSELDHPYEVELRMRCKDGTTKWLLVRGKITERDRDGTPLRMVGTNTDITVRHQHERALSEQSALLARAHEVAKLGAYVINLSEG